MNRYNPYNRAQKNAVNHDRHCQECGTLIKGAAHQKPGLCFKCKAPQDGRRGWRADGWGRCVDCDAWLHENHCFCLCGFANPEAIQRKNQQMEAARQQAAFRKEQETKELKRQLMEATRANMVLQQQIDQRQEDERARQNNEMFLEQMRGVNLENEDELE